MENYAPILCGDRKGGRVVGAACSQRSDWRVTHVATQRTPPTRSPRNAGLVQQSGLFRSARFKFVSISLIFRNKLISSLGTGSPLTLPPVGVHPYALTPLVRFYSTRVLAAVLDTIYESHLSSVNDTNSDDS
jgi:hypothetical protein